jgi:hypothetical protein
MEKGGGNGSLVLIEFLGTASIYGQNFGVRGKSKAIYITPHPWPGYEQAEK